MLQLDAASLGERALQQGCKQRRDSPTRKELG